MLSDVELERRRDHRKFLRELDAENEARRQRKEAWAKERGLRQQMVGRGGCAHWLFGRRGYCDCRERNAGWMDHVSCWVDREGERMLLAQPYGLGLGYLQEVAEVAGRLGMLVRVTGTGWHCEGTVAIELRKAKHDPH